MPISSSNCRSRRVLNPFGGVLAEGVLRSLGAESERVPKDSDVHRGQSSEGCVSAESAGLSLVERGRREESRRGTHECVRHVRLTLMGQLEHFRLRCALPEDYFLRAK
jgi:hypothetical protein